MFVTGISAFQIALFALLAVALMEFWRLRRAGPNLVLREFRVGTDSTAGEFLYILGRRSGIVAWVLTLFGLEVQTSLSVTDDEVTLERVGPRGFTYSYAPLAEISASHCSYYRAFGALVLSLAFYAYGLWNLLRNMPAPTDYDRQTQLASASATLWACLILGTVCYVWYALSKRVLISVIANGEVTLGISFKRSVIENLAVELKRSIEAVDLMNRRILAKHSIPERKGA